jgi:hypothetical protein
LIVLRRKVKERVRLTNGDRWFFIQLYRWFPSILKVLTIVHPETLVRWHRAGFLLALEVAASSRLFDLNGETKMARTKSSSPIIPPAYAIPSPHQRG